MLRVAEVAKAASTKSNIINMLQVPGANDAQQVMLQVRFAEVNRKALLEVGANFLHGPGASVGRPQHDGAVLGAGIRYGSGGLVFSDFLNLFLFNNSTTWAR